MNDVNNGLIQAIRGPIMLIALGGLVEIDYMGIYGFGRTWPILIILFGILKLMEKIVSPQTPSYPNPPSGGSAI
jgi:hypothetical protein